MDVYTGARWGELVGQQRHEYDSERRGIEIRSPLREVVGKVYKGDRNPCGDSVRGVADGDRGAL
jgi:hypothetical protein